MLITACHCALCHCYSSQLGISHQNLVEKNVLNHQPASTSGAPGKGDKVAVDVAMDTSACRRPCRAGVGRTSETTTTRRTLRSSSKECGHPTESLTSRNFRNRQASDFNDCNSASAVRPKYESAVFALQWVLLLHSWVGANERQIQRPSRGLASTKVIQRVALQPLSDS